MKTNSTDRSCRVEHCEAPLKRNGFCYAHYMKNWRYGSPTPVRKPTWVDLRGQKFGTLTVLNRKGSAWRCRCDCGRVRVVRAGELNRTGDGNSCGHPHPAVKPRVWRNGQCQVCGKWFTTARNQARFCSPKCVEIQGLNRGSERRALQRNTQTAQINRIEVFKADGYRCHICKRKCDPSKKSPHPRSPTIDHITPLSRGGTHELMNIRTACRRCNIRKGNKGGGEQFALAV